jgi:hypothetical protein
MRLRPLRSEEISTLKSNGCRSETWDTIEVIDDFKTANIRNVRFSGTVRLGRFNGRIELEPGLVRACGIYNTSVTDCTIGNNAYIAGVQNLFRYRIGDDVIIENTGTLAVTGSTAFGNGIRINVLNEAGGRELTIFDTLSSQIAYLMVTCRHERTFIEHLTTVIDAYVKTKASQTGMIDSGARIRNCGSIRNVAVGPHARLTGATLLEEGTIASSHHDPVFIGYNVSAKNFIVQSGTVIDNGALLTDCFIGQGVRIGKQLSAEHSAFFANCEGFHGEMCSIFAGPYSVSHHKSTLLIAGMFSFYNAGSGTNQSNHMYKLGPVHQGILERGAKTGSFSYLLWPSRIGPFTAVIGAHHANFDASEFPFSYIHEEDGKSVLTPAMNLFSVGTHRDSIKWPDRDRRKDSVKHDLLHFDLFNPYTIRKVLQAQKILTDLGSTASKEQEFVTYKGLSVKRLLIKTVVKYYELAVQMYIGNELMKRLGKAEPVTSIQDMRRKLGYEITDYCPSWIDAGGMFMPKSAYDTLVTSVSNGDIDSLDRLTNTLGQIFTDYDRTAWAWCATLIERRVELPINQIQSSHLIRIVQEWHDSSLKLNNMIGNDAVKEFDAGSRIGFGVDGDESVRDLDFDAVRGTYDQHSFILRLKKQSETIRSRKEEVIRSLEALG